MKLQEFEQQAEYCRAHRGTACADCPATDKDHCAATLLKLCTEWINALEGDPNILQQVSRRLDREYGLKPYNQLALCHGVLELPGKEAPHA